MFVRKKERLRFQQRNLTSKWEWQLSKQRPSFRLRIKLLDKQLQFVHHVDPTADEQFAFKHWKYTKQETSSLDLTLDRTIASRNMPKTQAAAWNQKNLI